MLHFFPRFPSAEDKKEKTPNINSQTSTKTTLIIIEEQKRKPPPVMKNLQLLEPSLRLAKWKMKTVSC